MSVKSVEKNAILYLLVKLGKHSLKDRNGLGVQKIPQAAITVLVVLLTHSKVSQLVEGIMKGTFKGVVPFNHLDCNDRNAYSTQFGVWLWTEFCFPDEVPMCIPERLQAVAFQVQTDGVCGI